MVFLIIIWEELFLFSSLLFLSFPAGVMVKPEQLAKSAKIQTQGQAGRDAPTGTWGVIILSSNAIPMEMFTLRAPTHLNRMAV